MTIGKKANSILQYYDLVALGTDRDIGNLAVSILTYCPDIFLSLTREVLPAAALCGVALPALEGTEYGLCPLLPVCIRKVSCDLTVKLIGLADLDLLE